MTTLRKQEWVIHVAEAFGGGVAVAVRDYVDATPEFGHVALVHVRDTARMPEEWLAQFDEVVEMSPHHFKRVWQVRALRRRYPTSVLHAHSSFAGLYTRLVSRNRVVYTPHCFAFLRTDIPAWARWLIRIVEIALARRATVAACSEYEMLQARRLSSEAHLVPNRVPTSLRQNARGARGERRPRARIIGVGRLCAQKAPDWYLAVVKALRAQGACIEALWIGDGEITWREQLEAEGVTVTGWLDHSSGSDLLDSGDVYVHSAAWEGFPLSLLEAAALNVPSVVRDVPTMRTCRHPLLAADPEAASRMVHEILAGVYTTELEEYYNVLAHDNSRVMQASALTSVYTGVLR